jgi:tetratricopeptide (TPR) repeat protein
MRYASLPKRTASFAAVVVLCLPAFGFAQRAEEDKDKAPQPTYDETTAKRLNEAIEFLNMEQFEQARAVLAKLNLDKLSPYERSHVEQIFASIAHSQENYEQARKHLQNAIAAGGLNEVELSQVKYQIAQLFMSEERWKEGAAALEDWFKTATNPNAGAYYLLAVAYYQIEQYDRALTPARKSVEMSEKPQESWIELVVALYLQKEQYREALPYLEQLLVMSPDKKAHWLRLSSIYGQLEDYPKALATMQLAYNAGLLSEDSEIRRLADLLQFQEVPYRAAQVLQTGIEKKQVKETGDLYEKLANAWIAAREFGKAVAPLERAAQMEDDGNLFVRLGEVQVQREDWAAAVTAFQRALDKGGLKDAPYVQYYIGIAHYNQKNYREARSWFQRAAGSSKYGRSAGAYIQLIDSKNT